MKKDIQQAIASITKKTIAYQTGQNCIVRTPIEITIKKPESGGTVNTNQNVLQYVWFFGLSYLPEIHDLHKESRISIERKTIESFKTRSRGLRTEQ